MSLIDDNFTANFGLIEFMNADFQEFQSNLAARFQSVTNVLENIRSAHTHPKSVDLQNCDVDLKTLMEQNRQYKLEIISKTEALNARQAQYEKFKQDRKVLSQEIKDTHESLLMAKKYYKKYLKFYYTIEKTTDSKQIIFVQFFTESKKDGDKFSVRLHRDIKTAHYTLEDMSPMLKSFKELQTSLQETNDVPYILYQIRQGFLKYKNK